MAVRGSLASPGDLGLPGKRYLQRTAAHALPSFAAEAGYDPAAAVALLEHAQLLQIQYGAIILSFLGAVHWGFEVR